jgi:DNA polymerase-1
MAGKLVLIDGHSILNRAFYGVPDLTNGEGLHTNAVYGFLNIMFKILDEEKPDYLTVAFDVKHKTFRHEMFSEYKGTRKPMPAELHEQVPVLKELLKAMNIQIMELPGFEADDLLGTIAKRADGDDIEVRVVSGDRDLLQLATDRIMIRIPKTKMGKTEVENYYAKDVLEKYQVSPLEFIDLKALMGDTADNIPGVAGIGEKMATKIISTYHSIENAYENLDNIEPKRAGKLLGEDYESAKLSKVLATINTDAPIEIDYKNGTLDNMYNSEALAIIKKLEFKKLAEKFLANGADSATAQSVNLEELIQKISKDDIDYNALSKAEYVGIQIFEVGDVNNEPTQMTFDFLNTASNEDKEKYVLSYSFVLDEKEYV